MEMNKMTCLYDGNDLCELTPKLDAPCTIRNANGQQNWRKSVFIGKENE